MGRCWDLGTCLGSSLYLSPVIKAICFPSCQDPCVHSISTSSQPARPLPCWVSNVETRVIRCISGKKQMELGSRENQALKPSRNTFQSQIDYEPLQDTLSFKSLQERSVTIIFSTALIYHSESHTVGRARVGICPNQSLRFTPTLTTSLICSGPCCLTSVKISLL